ncbi:Card1-like endonuclease domain-containing protein [Undibacterium sp.]|uniref:Card1-like endonuclease domain-containing protein n=1 Tax=Undibacterium sp. TaxID=1914977 RepID=UPI003753E0CD
MSGVHVCLISAQAMPNFMAVIRYRPDAVHLVVTKEMHELGMGERFADLLQQSGCQEVVIHRSVPGTGLVELVPYAVRIASELATRYEGSDIVLNFTGGTKLLSMAFVFGFQDVFENCKLLYTDTDHRRFEFMEGNTCFSDPIPVNLINIPQYIAAQGGQIIGVNSDLPGWKNRCEGRADLTHYLAEYVVELDHLFDALNNASGKAFRRVIGSRDQFLESVQTVRVNEPNAFVAFAWQRILELKLLIPVEGHRYRFASEEAARYLGGFWLEEYAFLAASKIGLHDIRCGLSVRFGQDRSAPLNEFDLVAIHHNRVVLVECKTGNFGDETKSDEVLYKLDALGTRLARVFGEKVLLSARPMKDSTRQRAKKYKIELLEGRQLNSFENRLRKMLS